MARDSGQDQRDRHGYEQRALNLRVRTMKHGHSPTTDCQPCALARSPKKHAFALDMNGFHGGFEKRRV
jgi:hypothetical protein